MNEVYVSSTAL